MSTFQSHPPKLPTVQEWKRSAGNQSLTLIDYIASNADVNLTLAITRFLWPKFIEVRGCVLLPWVHNPEVFEQWWTKLEGEQSIIEKTLNHVHLWDIFEVNEEQSNDDTVLEGLANLIAKLWRSALVDAFPDRKFLVTASNDKNDYGPTVMFCSVK